ncbi:hypothetical protein ACWEKT_12840 [Nocardia takedensis]
MSVLFEVEYERQRHVGLGLPVPGRPHTLYRVDDGAAAAAVIAGGSALSDLLAAAERREVDLDGPDVRYLPPLLPRATNNALVNGFMGTHRTKFDHAPAPDQEFVAPNYYQKGFGSWLKLPGEALVTPAEPIWLLEEPEVALVFVNDAAGVPHYAGYTFGNDLNDIGLHLKKPWAWTPYAKLCETSITPWLFLGPPPTTVTGRVTIERAGAPAWSGAFSCGADSLYHRVADTARHVLSYPLLRRPGLVNYLLLGADKASYHAGFRIEDGDRLVLDVTSHGVVLDNPVRFGPVAPEIPLTPPAVADPGALVSTNGGTTTPLP